MAVPTAPDVLAQQLRNGNRRALARAITLAESSLPADVAKAQHLLESVMPYTGNAVRVGITGVPGVGKSTFIEALGMQLIADGHRVAVLAVDPSSPNSGGSILGDKTRMQELLASDKAFIRPSPTSGTLGGVARKTRESVFLCEAAGFDIILVETVGVGQSEYEVASMVDFFMVLMLPGAGDALQGIKKGILELADMIVVNKAEGDQKKLAKHARSEYKNALHLIQPKHADYEVKVMLCSALQKVGIRQVWEEIKLFIQQQKETGVFVTRRHNQLRSWMLRMTEESLLNRFRNTPGMTEAIEEFSKALANGETTAVLASKTLLQKFDKSN